MYRPPVGGPPGYWGGGPHVENPIYRPGAADVKAAMMAKIVAAVRFWTGNLPPGPEQPPTPHACVINMPTVMLSQHFSLQEMTFSQTASRMGINNVPE